jgi:hypothetical protein
MPQISDVKLVPSAPADAVLKLNLRHTLRPLTEDEYVTSRCLLQGDPSAQMTIVPTHHVDADGHLNGFLFECDGKAPASCLPVSRQMFFGHTAVECHEDETTILALMMDKKAVLQKLQVLCEGLKGIAPPARLDCIPENCDSLSGNVCMQATDLRTVDAQEWSPEAPFTLGLYHAYIRGYSRDLRAHRLFIVCSGGLDNAADEFCNLLIDVGDKWTAGDVADSVETWWLRRASQRARCRLLALAAETLGVCIDSIQDTSGYNREKIAVPCTDTFQHNILSKSKASALASHTNSSLGLGGDLHQSQDRVAVYNGCTPTTGRFNGILVRMAPSEGFRIFRGSGPRHGFGSAFGDDRTCGVFPVCQPRVPRNHESVLISDGDFVCRQTDAAGHGLANAQHYMCFDEAYYKTLEQMLWNRDNGVVELIPIVVWCRSEA